MAFKAALALIRNAWGDVRGVSAIEFSFIAPVMILIYFGMAELSSALMAERKSSHALSTLGDLVTRAPQSATAADMAPYLGNVVQGAIDMMAPFPTTKTSTQNGKSTTSMFLQVRTTSVSVRTDNTVQVDWSCSGINQSDSTLTPLAKDQPVLSSTGTAASVNGISTSQSASIWTLLTAPDPTTGKLVPTSGASIVISQGSYLFNSPVDYFLPNPVTLRNMFFFRPRNLAVLPSPGTITTSQVQCNG